MSEPLISDASEGTVRTRRSHLPDMPLWALAFLVLTVAVSVLWGHYLLIGGDDILEIWCDRVATISQLVHIQRTTPLVIDPFLFHGLTFANIRLFGITPFFLRLPSLAGFLLMQLCLFYFVRRIATPRTAMFALAFPACTVAFTYTLQIRPYGLLLGLFGLAMLSWQTAARRDQHRAAALVLLSLSIAAAVNSQYFGVLLMLPLGAAEAVRSRQRRRLDTAMLLALAAGMAGMIFVLPFVKGAMQFRGHYKAGNVPYQSITQSYNFFLLGRGAFSVPTNHGLAVLLGLLIVIVLTCYIRLWRSGTLRLPDAEFVFLLVLAALPVFAFLLGHFITHAMEPRYALGAVIGVTALLAIALTPLLESRIAGPLILAALCIAFVWKGALEIRAERTYRAYVLSQMILSPQMQAAILSSPAQSLYTQDISLLGSMAFHSTNPALLHHLVLVYSENQEMRWLHSSTDSKIIENLKTFTPYTIVPYASVIHAPGDHLFVVTHGGWNWLDMAFADRHLQVTPVGSAFGGEVVSVHAPSPDQEQP